MKLTLRQAAERLGTTRQNVYKQAKLRGMLQKKDAPGTPQGWMYFLSERDLEKLKEK